MIAITRGVAATIQQAEVTFVEAEPIDYALAAAQHEQYRALLASLGCELVNLPADDAHPDCVFIEDTAIVLDDLAVITRPGAESRRGETRAVADALEAYRRLVHITAPATIDGGDVLVTEDRIYAGLSTRTNEAAVAQLRLLTGREVVAVPVNDCLHLKSAVTRVSRDTLLVNRSHVDARLFDGWKLIDVDPAEPAGANALLVGDVVVYPAGFDRTRARLEAAGIEVRTVEQTELAKAEGGVTCCSLLLEVPPRAAALRKP